MNKSVVLFNLKIPQDVIHLICRFGFYTRGECIENIKQKYNKVIQEINYIKRFQYYGYQVYHGLYYHIQINIITVDDTDICEMNICICIHCNEIIKNKSTASWLCKC